MRPSLGIAMFALVGACTNDFGSLTIGNPPAGEAVGASATSSSSGSGATASSAAGGDETGDTGGLGANVADAGTTGGAAGAGGTGGAPVTAPPCQDQYGAAVTLMCEQTETQCSFNFANGSQSCAAVCTAGGGECVEMFSDYSDNCGFDPLAPQGCEYVGFGDAVCICSRGCGGGAACVAPALCNGGNCL